MISITTRDTEASGTANMRAAHVSGGGGGGGPTTYDDCDALVREGGGGGGGGCLTELQVPRWGSCEGWEVGGNLGQPLRSRLDGPGHSSTAMPEDEVERIQPRSVQGGRNEDRRGREQERRDDLGGADGPRRQTLRVDDAQGD